VCRHPRVSPCAAGHEDVARDMERQVHALLESSAAAVASGDVSRALELAKDAGRKERALGKVRV
jgi:hypothetical protein